MINLNKKKFEENVIFYEFMSSLRREYVQAWIEILGKYFLLSEKFFRKQHT